MNKNKVSFGSNGAFGFTIHGLLSCAIMSVVVFDPNLPVQSIFAITGLRVFYYIFSVLCTLYAIHIMWDYEIDKARIYEIMED